MAVGTISHEIQSPVEATRLWNGLVKEGHKPLIKQVPELFSSITFLQGERGLGCINLNSANKDFSHVKERVEEVDEEQFVYRYSHVEGGLLGTKVASVTYEFKCSTNEERCVCSSIIKFESLPGVPRVQE